MYMDWTYFVLNKNGRLYEEDGDEGNVDWPTFDNAQQAEDFLIKNDIRGSVR